MKCLLHFFESLAVIGKNFADSHGLIPILEKSMAHKWGRTQNEERPIKGAISNKF